MSNIETSSEDEKSIILDKPFESTLKDKVVNKLFIYILISFVVVNWQEILIILKAKEDIYYTLSMVFTSQRYHLGSIDFMAPAWVAHFVLPFFFGSLASFVAPHLTYFISRYTALPLARMRHLENDADIRVKNQLLKVRMQFIETTKKSNKLEDEVARLRLDIDELTSTNKTLKNERIELFQGIASFVHAHDRIGGVKNEKDLVEFLKAVESSDFFKDQTLYGKVNKMVADLKEIYKKSESSEEEPSDNLF